MATATLAELLVDVWRQALVDRTERVVVGAASATVGTTRALGLRTVAFSFAGHAIEGIEQNPQKPSRWGQLARDGQRIMQFSCRHRYFANVCEGKVTRYPLWKSLELPE